MSNSISGIVGTNTNYISAVQANKTNQLDRDAFLKLLLTQLANQDPLKPMEDKAFIAELAQFSSLEQMQGVNRGFEAFNAVMQPFILNQMGFAAASWVGRTITAADPNPPVDLDGKLTDPVLDKDGKPLIGGNGKEVVKNITSEVQGVQFTADGPTFLVKVTQKVYDVDTNKIVEREVTKNIPLSYISKVT